RAVLDQERGDGDESRRAIAQALERAHGQERAAVATLGARLALASGQRPETSQLFVESLKHDPKNVEALWCLAALRYDANDRDGLAALARAMGGTDSSDPRFPYLAAVWHLAAGDAAAAVAAAEKVPSDSPLAAESQYVVALARLRQDDVSEALAALEQVAQTSGSTAADHSRALLGRLYLDRGQYNDAVRCWTALDARQRAAWRLDDAVRGAVFLAGLNALAEEEYEGAAERFREAGRLGMRDRRLGSLLILALFKAGQRRPHAAQAPPSSAHPPPGPRRKAVG